MYKIISGICGQRNPENSEGYHVYHCHVCPGRVMDPKQLPSDVAVRIFLGRVGDSPFKAMALKSHSGLCSLALYPVKPSSRFLAVLSTFRTICIATGYFSASVLSLPSS